MLTDDLEGLHHRTNGVSLASEAVMQDRKYASSSVGIGMHEHRRRIQLYDLERMTASRPTNSGSLGNNLVRVDRKYAASSFGVGLLQSVTEEAMSTIVVPQAILIC